MRRKQAELLLNVLSALRRESKTPISGIAKMLGQPITTVFEAEKQLKQERILTRYYASFRFEPLGFGIKLLLILKCENEAQILKNPFLNNLQRLSGNLLSAEFIFGSMRQVLETEEKFREKIISSYYLFEQCKEENASIIFKNNEDSLL